MNRPQVRPARHIGRTPPSPLVHAPNAALLIDFDNVTLGIRSDLTKELKNLLNSDIIKGKVAVQRAYADWRRYPQYIVPLSESSIDLIFAPAFGTNKKNATDIRLAIDAIELVFTRPEIGTFIIMSGDSDFSTMVIKLKEYGKYVIGVGIRESASDILIQNCDEYYSYSDLAGLTKEADLPSAQRDPWELAGEAVVQMVRNGDVMRSDRLKQVMQQIDSNFDERNVGLNRFSKFVVEAAHRGVLQVTKLDNGQYEVSPAAGAPATGVTTSAEVAASPAPTREGEEGARGEGRRDRGRRRGGRGRERDRDRDRSGERTERPAAAPARDGALTLAGAFQLMTRALGELRAPVAPEPLRLRMVAMHGREDPLLEASRFVRFLGQANDAEIADIRKVGEDDYEISPLRSAAPSPSTPFVASAPASGASTGGASAAEASADAAPVSRDYESASSGPAASRENGQRFGVRFRHGSRRPTHQREIPLIGVVTIDQPAADVSPSAAEPEAAAVTAPDETSSAAPADAPKRGTRSSSRRRPSSSAKRGKAEASAPSASATATATATAKEASAKPASAKPASAKDASAKDASASKKSARPKRSRSPARKKAE